MEAIQYDNPGDIGVFMLMEKVDQKINMLFFLSALTDGEALVEYIDAFDWGGMKIEVISSVGDCHLDRLLVFYLDVQQSEGVVILILLRNHCS